MSAKIRILTVDDHPLLREGIAAMVATETDMAVVAEASNGSEALQLFRAHRPDFTLMDIQMPIVNGSKPSRRSASTSRTRGSSCSPCTATLRSSRRSTPLRYVPAQEHAPQGADGDDPQRARGQETLAARAGRGLASHYADDALTPREIEILREVAAGNANKIVADNLYISEETVRTHMRSILSKLGAERPAPAARKGCQPAIE